MWINKFNNYLPWPLFWKRDPKTYDTFLVNTYQLWRWQTYSCFIFSFENAGRENPEKNPCSDSAGQVPGPHRKNPGTVRVRVVMSDMRVGPGQPQTRTQPGLLPSLAWRLRAKEG
ncbi:hypothetical protein CISIN_1g038602mg [Citrus sinensis]|uniref:Uncharacterized protein n=1 Tax=Citrus sinensis TaxID=2711 RepID=A0A067FCF9_CITSI|nr:hypothetical protein CISIN_1g038602mg [Citrus sinensis]